MLLKTPRSLPALGTLLENLGNPHPRVVAKALGVTERTVWQWRAADMAPRPAMLALWWVSGFGLRQIDSDREYALANALGYVASLRDEIAALQADLGRLLALCDTGAANAPTWRALPVAPVFSGAFGAR